LAEIATRELGTIGGEMRRLMADGGYIDSVLHRGTEHARAIADENLRRVSDIMGLLRP